MTRASLTKNTGLYVWLETMNKGNVCVRQKQATIKVSLPYFDCVKCRLFSKFSLKVDKINTFSSGLSKMNESELGHCIQLLHMFIFSLNVTEFLPG